MFASLQQAEQAEFEIEDFVEKDKETEIKAFALVDLDNEIAYGFKVRSKDKNKYESGLRLY